MLSVGYKSFGELLPFLIFFHYCFLSNGNSWCFWQNHYGQEMVIRHGEQVDWRKTDIGSMALYASGGERAMDGETMVQF
jgi:hypothetical protein